VPGVYIRATKATATTNASLLFISAPPSAGM